MLRIAVCDDSTDALHQIESLILKWNSGFELKIHLFEDGDSLIQNHFLHPFDIIFLDVVMPLLSGIETAREIRAKDKSVQIVFLTSSIEYAYESYSVKAFNYLLKPAEADKFYECLDELVSMMKNSSKSIVIVSSGRTHRIGLHDVEIIEAMNKQVLITMKDGTKHFTNEPLYQIEKQFLESNQFFKCHRSYIVNLALIDSYSSKEVLMHSGAEIPLSRGLHKEFENAYFSALFGNEGDES